MFARRESGTIYTLYHSIIKKTKVSHTAVCAPPERRVSPPISASTARYSFLVSTMSIKLESRQHVFQKLKPICVGLTQTTLALNGPKGNITELTSRLELLNDIVSSFPSADSPLDDKLADYIFFPISQVLKLSQKVSIRCLELTLSVLAVLIEQGWRQRLQPQLATQVLILCTLLASDKPSGLASSDTTVELRTSALRCLTGTFEALNLSEEGRKLWQGEANMPQLGQTLSTILDALVGGVGLEIQLAAINAMRILIASMKGRDILAGFLPGIVSKLTKVLAPQTSQRRNHEVLVECLDILKNLLMATVGDEVSSRQSSTAVLQREGASNVSDSKWFEDAATQLKPALANVCRLKTHPRDDVRLALSRLCFMVLGKCQKTLANCANMTLETIIALIAGQSFPEIGYQLEGDVRMNPSLGVLLQETLHGWLQSLPRIMQSADEQAKTLRVEQIRTAYETLQNCHVDTTIIDRSVGLALRDSVVVVLQAPKSAHIGGTSVQTIQSLDVELLGKTPSNTDFGSALVQYRGQEDVMNSLESFVETIGRSTHSYALMSDMSRELRNSQDDTNLASFWLLYVAAKSAARSGDDMGDFLNMEDASSSDDLVEEMYSLSLEILNESSAQHSDGRLKSLALRALTLRAERAGKDFRYELIDALYPVLHTLATPNPLLQQDSVIALNKITEACVYSSTQELIVANVDYLTNAVALKLNAFDVSPQAPQVLLMMVRLAGSSLLPYLEDTVESIFAALEDFHGYPILVELLFKVLAVMAEEAVKAPQLTLTDGKGDGVTSHEVRKWLSPSMASLIDQIKTRNDDQEAVPVGDDAHEDFPRRPWAEDKDDKDSQADSEDEAPTSEHDQQESDEVAPPPAPKTYNLLLKIATLTQHFLPSASPSLRISLLGLIRTAVPALALHENSFLPLINTLWPELTARLEDSEVNVQVTALQIISVFCEHAKDFMRSRMLQLWPLLHEIYQRVAKDVVVSSAPSNSRNDRERGTGANTKLGATNTPSLQQAVARMKAAPADYGNTLTRMLWDAVINTILTAIQYVSFPPDKLDEALGLLEICLDDEKVRRAVEAQNADAVWLVDMRAGRTGHIESPAVNDAHTWRWAAIA
jgi:hypothetical protein